MRDPNQRRIEYTQVIWEITKQLREAESLADALRSSLEEVVRAIGAEAGSIWFYNEAGDGRIYPSFWIGTADMVGLSLAPGEGIAGSVVQSGRSEAVLDCAVDPRWAGRFDESTGFVTRSMICVPLINKYKVIGCIEIINKVDDSLYDEEDIALCENLAMLTAIAVDDRGLDLGFAKVKPVLMSLRAVTKTYGEGDIATRVLKGVNLDVLEGEFLVVLGESGCGKTTLLNILGGMDKADGGSVTINGLDIGAMSERQLTEYRREQVGFIFQTCNLMPNLTALQNLMYIAEICREPLDPAHELELVGLAKRMDHYPAQLSGGEQQRVAIARALIKAPRFILADEPTAALDVDSYIDVLTLLEQTVRQRGCTLIMVTHNIDIAKMADRVVHMRNGKIDRITVNAHPISAAELRE